jgi:hypothetical protein
MGCAHGSLRLMPLAEQVSRVKSFEKVPLTLPSPARGEGFLIPLPRREGLGEGEGI